MPFILIASAILTLFVYVGVRNFTVHKNAVVDQEETIILDTVKTIGDDVEPSEVSVPSQVITKSVTPKITGVTLIPTRIPTATPTPRPMATSTSIPSDTSAPQLDYMTGPPEGGTVDFSNFCFPMKFTDNRPGSIMVRYAMDVTTPDDWNQNFAPCYSGVANGQHTFRVQARDAAGNISIFQRNFSVLVPVPTPTVAVTSYPTIAPTRGY